MPGEKRRWWLRGGEGRRDAGAGSAREKAKGKGRGPTVDGILEKLEMEMEGK